MRALFLILLVIGLLIGLPRLADRFRDSSASRVVAGTGPAIGQRDAAPIRPAPGPQMAGPGANSATAPLLPVALKPATPPIAGPQVEPPPPTNEDELIAAIQKELARLGYYEGPVTTRWTKAARAAARSFLKRTGIRSRRPAPTFELLASLRAAKSDRPQEAKRASSDSVVPTVVPSRPQSPSNAVAMPVDARETGSKTEGYLPPWMRDEKTRPEPVAARPPAIPGEAKATNQAEDPGERRAESRHRRTRAARERAHWSRRREARIWFRPRLFFLPWL